MQISRTLVGSTLVALLITGGCAGSDAPALIQNPGNPNVVAVSATPADAFVPQQVTAHAGQTLEWTNTDTDNHAVKPDPGAPANLDSDVNQPNGIPPAGKYDFTVPVGTPIGTKIYYHCRFHGAAGDGAHLGPGMAGVITIN